MVDAGSVVVVVVVVEEGMYAGLHLRLSTLVVTLAQFLVHSSVR